MDFLARCEDFSDRPIRGFLDDPTASIHASVVSAAGTAEMDGIVERTGLFWIENLPLSEGQNQITLTARNALYETTASTTVTKSTVNITVDSMPGSAFQDSVVRVSCQISDTGYSLWVNGTKTQPDQNGRWTNHVAVNQGGTATLHVRAIPNTDNNGNGTPQTGPLDNVQAPNPAAAGAIDKKIDTEVDAFVRLLSYTSHYTFNQHYTTGDACTHDQTIGTLETHDVFWIKGVVGGDTVDSWIDECDANNQLQHLHSWRALDWDADGTPSAHGIDPDGNPYDCAVDPENWYCDLVFPPERPWEHCDVSFPWSEPDQDLAGDLTRIAQTRVVLFTGGKSIAHSKHLFTISGSLTIVSWPPWPQTQWQRSPGPAGMMKILGKRVGYDGLLYLPLPDNQVFPVTPEITGGILLPHYEFNVGAIKHKVLIRANGTALDPDHQVTGSTNCVGQKVTFTYELVPWPLSLQRTIEHWYLSGDFVNHSWQYGYVYEIPYGSVNYDVDPDLLLKPSTYAWWVTGDGSPASGTFSQAARLALFMEFGNGQTAFVNEQGRFAIHRPIIETPVTWSTLNAGARILGSDVLVLDRPEMTFTLRVRSEFQGRANYVQLVRADNQSDEFPERVNTHGEFWLDNTCPYSTEDEVRGDLQNGTYVLLPPLRDAPRFPGRTYVIKSGFYQSYCRFRPGDQNSNQNIWVTLGLVQWYWDATAEWDATTEKLVVTYSECPGPGFTPSSQFPVWTKVLHNNISYW